ncbi:hypothetical protein PENSTE_c019G05133 [Penicillium steckii]|uniref:Uncharacterized protein n=1 Tax=Penicillium steckii TaxID=303698 RepID=A0A1V6SVX3_9EURO|nr:hypothetical protein PENSTE_c019G05133 [Penicillium steckii]
MPDLLRHVQFDTIKLHLQDEQTKIVNRQESQEAELRAQQDLQIKLFERQMQQDEYLKILQDGQAEILGRQQSHHEEIIQVLLWQNQLISTAIPQSPRPSFTSTTSPGSPPLTEFSPPPKKRTQSSANSFVWGFTKPLDSNGGTGPVLTRNTRLPRLEKKKRLASLGTQVAYGRIIPAIARYIIRITSNRPDGHIFIHMGSFRTW